ncbi:hypothetical protein [Bradyrhizobium zhanjiangense]|uniref:Uncharacterized protein n=1 Tax=Bradyrhizobium zhanjiangense TaxID=1325107 RepID=A0A4Q0QRV2_9BRAD|nr:hypothetical protein [Bradyrhizobium zhanjiangense]RXH00163.1 hypothetical protein EAS61_10915 [Bradyrhizobium zhanjiangense]
MRKLILIAAMSLLATQVHAGGSRSLSLAATNPNQQAAEPSVTSAAPQAPAATPPANIQTATTTPTTTTAPVATAPAQSAAASVSSTTEAAKPKRRQPSVEARVIRELHRHGIYW